jgi:hypothetical protein
MRFSEQAQLLEFRKHPAMRRRLLGSLLAVSIRKRRALPFTRSRAQYGRPSLECFETRALPSILTAAPGFHATVELALTVAQPVSTSLNSSDQTQPTVVLTQSQPGGQAGLGSSTVIQTQMQQWVEIKLQSLNLVPAQFGKPQQDQGQSTDTSGQGNSSVDAQGDAQGGQTDNSDNGSANLVGDNQGDQPVNPDDGQTGPSDSGDSGATDSSSQGVSDNSSAGDSSSPGDGGSTDGQHNSNHCHRTTDGSSGGQSDTSNTQVDPGQSDPAGSPTGQTSIAGQPSAAGQTSTTGQGSNIIPSTSDGKISTSPADPIAASPDIAIGADLGAIPAASNQSSASDKRQRSPNDASSILEAGQRGPASVQESKQRTPDGTFAVADEVRSPLAVRYQWAEQHSRNPVDGQSQLQNPTDDSAQRLLAERFRTPDASRGYGITETPVPPGEAAVFVGELPDDTARVVDYNAPPQNHGLLTDRLGLDFSSLRAEVHHFFEHIERLGVHAPERQIGPVICSLAVVVTAAMACEVAWRQARRPAANLPFALASTLDVADDAGGLAAMGLPHFGQFSALS